MLKCSFTYGQIEEILAAIHFIDPERRVAFQGRLKHLQRWDFPTGKKPGKGKSIDYNAAHLFKMVIALELIQAGIPPKLAVDLTDGNWHDMQTTIYLNADAQSADGGWCWLFRPEAMRALTIHGESEYDKYEAVVALKSSELAAALLDNARPFRSHFGTKWRTLVLNGYELVQGVFRIADFKLSIVKKKDLTADLLALVEADHAKIKANLASLDGLFANAPKLNRPDPPMSERVPDTLIEQAKNLIALHYDLFKKIADAGEQALHITEHELILLRDHNLIAVEADEIVYSGLMPIIIEILREESNNANSQT